MAVIGTFGSFTAARMGIYTSQAALNVTGNNIANINTTGYTRQQLDLVSLHSGGSDRYSTGFGVNIGYGVMAKGVSQLRDPYLDIRFRNEQASLGANEAKLEGLNGLQAILDEVGKGEEGFGVLENQLNDFRDKLSKLSGNVGSREFDTLVRSSATVLTQLLNSYSKELGTIETTQQAALEQNVSKVNSTLDSIRSLNEEIRTASIHGDGALELRDRRNRLIDELSASMKVDVTYGNERIDENTEIEKLVITLSDSNPPIHLVDGIYTTQVSVKHAQLNPAHDPADPSTGGKYLKYDGTTTSNESEANQVYNEDYQMVLAPLTDSKGRYRIDEKSGTPLNASVTLKETDTYGKLQSIREFLTRKGEFSTAADLANDKNANVKRGVPYYQNVLDSLARKFAETFNGANQIDSSELNDAGGVRKPEYANYMGGVLFSNKGDGDDTTNITAGNISVSKSWATEDVRVLNTKKPMADGLSNSTANDNINHMTVLMGTKLDYSATDINPGAAAGRYFNGTFQEMLTSIGGTLATDIESTTALYNNFSFSALSLDNERSSVSGVDLNEEATNMMQFQKTYSAACRLLTTVDEMLDKLINATAL